ncbi:MAG: hypothetical protein QM747_12895 [Nocardioides sp.]
MADEWFRSPGWGPDDQAEFERRLARARRTSRAQYLRIKGLALIEAGHSEAARELWLRVLGDAPASIDRWSTLEHLGDLDFATDPDESERRYRELLMEDPSLNATTQMAEVWLAELLTRRGTPASLAEAWELLEAWRTTRHSPFPANHFQWEVARARWGEAAGRADITRESAQRAIGLADAESPFPRHPGVGVVHTDPALLAWLHARS